MDWIWHFINILKFLFILMGIFLLKKRIFCLVLWHCLTQKGLWGLSVLKITKFGGVGSFLENQYSKSIILLYFRGVGVICLYIFIFLFGQNDKPFYRITFHLEDPKSKHCTLYAQTRTKVKKLLPVVENPKSKRGARAIHVSHNNKLKTTIEENNLICVQ